jgi:starch-binding outer membrane protein, SusD/RagB family
MQTIRFVRALSAFAVAAALSGCKSLEVTNPNEPDAERALSDPSAVEAVAAGAMRTWFNAWEGLTAAGPLSAMARSYSSSWNNANMNFYSSIDNPTAPSAQWNRNSRGWQNDPAAAARTSVEWYWMGGPNQTGPVTFPGVYSALSSATDALIAIRKNDIVVRNEADTRRAEAIASLMQGASLMAIALNFDKGFVVDEESDLTTLQYSNRKELRDAAVAKLEDAISVATANTFTTPQGWSGGGATYTNAQIARVARTMAAMTLAYYPRTAAENSQVDWTKVAQLASAGMGGASGAPFNFVFIGDGCTAWCPEILVWFNFFDSGRLSTRVARLLDPATQTDPWPVPNGNAQPNSADRRMGDGSFGDAEMAEGFATVPKTANGGTDFAWTANGAVFRPDRGDYHQSNLAHVRYDQTGNHGASGMYGGFGPATTISAALNDLLWAEALLRRTPADPTTAAQMIDRTRVTRGGLPTATAAVALVGAPDDGPCMSNGLKSKDNTACSLWSMLLYEKEVELLGLGATPFWEQRRLPLIVSADGRHVAGLLPGTPREMPVPAKELGVKGEALYTWGGATPNSPPP